MQKLLNDQMLDVDIMTQIQQKDMLITNEKLVQEQESEIEKGNLQDYLEIYGELDDN